MKDPQVRQRLKRTNWRAIKRDRKLVWRKEVADIRNTKLKVIFTADQMKIWTDETAPFIKSTMGQYATSSVIRS